MQLLNWLLKRRPKAVEAAPPSVVATLKATVAKLQRLPTLPQAATRAMAVAKDPDVSLEKLAAVIERDPALTASVLKMANSALFRTAVEARTLHQAVVKVGLREVYNLVLAVAMRSMFRNLPRAQQVSYDALWGHSFLTACLCRSLNDMLRLGIRGEEFTCGLTHDIGRVVVAISAPDLFMKADPVDFVEGPDLLAREQAILGIDHCALGMWFAEQNDLPGPVVNAIEFHHTPAEADESPRLVALVAAADHAANYYQRTGGLDGYEAEANTGWQLLREHLGVAVADDALTAAVEEATAEASGVATAA